MTEPATPESPPAPTPGSLLRQARQARGVHLMALSASLKVAAARLEAMEHDRWHELPDAAYARALAHTVCRALHMDPEPVLRGLPAATSPRLDTLDAGIDEPFRDGPSGLGRRARRHRLTVVGLGLVLAAGVWAWLDEASRTQPAGATSGRSEAPGMSHVGASAPRTASEAATPASAALPSVPTSGSSQDLRAPAASPEVQAMLRVVALQASWLEVRDAQGQVRLSRVVAPGEELQLPFAAPVNLTVGNAAATRIWVNGQAIDLSGATRENVARIELR